jgi:lipopolysaccharide export system protein LptA
MKLPPHLPLLLLLLFPAAPASAQKPADRPPTRPDDAAALEEAIRAVDRAAEKKSPAKKEEPGEGVAKSKPANGAQPAKPAAPTTGEVAPGAKPDGAAAGGAKPAKPKAVAVTQTQITGLEDAELDNARNLIIFRKNVVVDRPDLKIWCDQLEIALNREPAKPGPGGNAKPKTDQEPDAFGAESIKSATATAADGGLVVVWRKTDTGDVVAVGRRAVYTAADGAFTITGVPEVLQNMSFHFHSPGEADRLIMFKNGSARGSKKTDLNLSAPRAREIRQRMFSHVPGRRPAEATAPAETAESTPDRGSVGPADTLPVPPIRNGARN